MLLYFGNADIFKKTTALPKKFPAMSSVSQKIVFSN